MRGPRCPDCGRPTQILVAIIICAHCKYAALEWQFLARVDRAERVADSPPEETRG